MTMHLGQEGIGQAGIAPKRLTISSQVVPGLIVALDSILVLMLGVSTIYPVVGDLGLNLDQYIFAVTFVWLVAVMLMHFAGQYDFNAIMQPLAYVDKFAVAFLTTFLFFFAVAFSLRISSDFSRIWIVAFAVASCTSVLLGRVLTSRLIGYLVDQRVFTRNIVVVGDGQQAGQFLAHIANGPRRFVSVLGIFTTGQSTTTRGASGYRRLGGPDDLTSYIRRHRVDDVVIALPWSEDAQIVALTAQLRELPVNVYLARDLVGFRLPLRPAPAHFNDLRIVEVVDRPLSGWGWVFKLAVDYGLGLVLTVLSLPLMGLIAAAIKIESRGPVFFRQARYGFKNGVFFIWKFRSMTDELQSAGATRQATRNDPRVTRVGRFLRRTSLDELPQLFNVLDGSMSLIGPRPHAVDHNEEFAKLIGGYFARHRVKPGITGWAQVNGLRGETRALDLMARRVESDVYYAENWSLLFDLRILLKTIAVCLTGKNAY